MIRTLDLHMGRSPAVPVFGAVAAAVLIVGMISLDRSGGAAVVVTAVTADIVLVLPALYYLLVVRGRSLPVITVLPVFRISLVAAALVLPEGDRPLYEALAHLARPAEVGMAAYVLFRLSLGVRAFRAAVVVDLLDRYRTGVRAALPPSVPDPDRAAGAIAFEGALLTYATQLWRRRPEVPAGATAFTGHRATGYGGIAFGLLVVIVAEIVVLHLLVSRWSGAAAWVLTLLGVYGALWIIGDMQAIRLRPSWLDATTLRMRLGLRWDVTIPRSRIRRARRLAAGEAAEGALRLALPNARRVLIEFDGSATALGVYGIMRAVEAVELGVDDPDGFLNRLGGQPCPAMD